MGNTFYMVVSVIMMILLFVLLIWGKISPVIALILVPVGAAIVCGFPLSDVGDWVTAGLQSQVSTVAMFMFAIIFFSCLMDTGMFDILLDRLLSKATSVTLICLITIVATMLGHLDGSGATTFLLVIPPLLPLYKRMNMRPLVLMALVSLTAGVMNMLPWGGPCARVAIGLEMEANDVFLAALPGFVTGIICCVILAVVLAQVEKKRGAGVQVKVAAGEQVETLVDEEKARLTRPKLFWFNLIMMIVTIVCIFTLDVPTALVFAVAGSIALCINYPGAKAQSERLMSYAPTCLTMISIGLAAGVYTGIFNNSPLQEALSNTLISLLDGGISAHLNTILGYLWAPLATIGLNHEATVYTILPTIANICSDFVTPAQVGATYLMTFSTRVFASPLTAAMYVGLGLCGVELKDHLRFTLPCSWIISTIIMTVALIVGAVPF
ncbi:MAG: citrate:proton symporter [Clostridiales bacterium]|nr:citrate:proton symporter [Clostridiales bacterium]